VSAVTDLPKLAWFTNGRTALAHAALLASIGPGDSILVPAYHCESMIEPFVWLDAKPVPYRINPDLSPDLEDVTRLSGPAVRAILVPQYFGHIRSIEGLGRRARQSGWTVIEDCAHAFFNLGASPVIGRDSDFVIASLPKFFPVMDGGILASRLHDLSGIRTRRPRLRDEARGLVDMIEYAAEYGRWSWISGIVGSTLAAARGLRASVRKPGSKSPLPASRHGGVEFEPEHVDLAACATSRTWPYHVDRGRHAYARRQNWQTIRDGLVQVPGVRLPVDELGADDVPYVFGLDTTAGAMVYPELKRQGVPIYRWETRHPGITDLGCPNAARFQSDLLQLPCHQSLTRAELSWIVATVSDVLRRFA